jgi:hypothetical protein
MFVDCHGPLGTRAAHGESRTSTSPTHEINRPQNFRTLAHTPHLVSVLRCQFHGLDHPRRAGGADRDLAGAQPAGEGIDGRGALFVWCVHPHPAWDAGGPHRRQEHRHHGAAHRHRGHDYGVVHGTASVFSHAHAGRGARRGRCELRCSAPAGGALVSATHAGPCAGSRGRGQCRCGH